MKKILITGAGTGLGKAAALALAQRGHHVYATTIDEAQAGQINELGRAEGLRLEGFKLDVTLEPDRQKIVGLELDVLLNNAGVGYSGSLAELDVDTVRKNFEINVFGPIRLTQIALRGMIARKRGTVMLVSSIAGRITAPFLASYCMTKYALEAAGEALRGEMEMLGAGIKVCLIEPGPYNTGFNKWIMENKFDWMEKGSYFQDRVEAMKEQDSMVLAQMEVQDISSIIDKIVSAAESDNPDLRYFAPEHLLPLVKEAENAR
jgi:NAD(P)-dependent dehydrogenase (short-subunit alcohol dehydrogenase family)